MEFPDAEKLAALAAEKGLTLSGAPCNHLGEAAQAMKRTLAQGRIGKPVLAYAEADDDLIALAPVHLWKNVSGAPWPREDEFEVGCTLEHVGYYLTWLVFFFGPIESVTAFASLQHPGQAGRARRRRGAGLLGGDAEVRLRCRRPGHLQRSWRRATTA